MLEGWYCRTLNEQASQNQPNEDDSSDEDSQNENEGPPAYNNNHDIDYKSQYKYLKQKLKYLIYENESFQDALRSSQRRLLKISRDRSFLLDRLLQYERPSGSETEETESSGDENLKNESKKRKVDENAVKTTTAGSGRGRKRKNAQQPSKPKVMITSNNNSILNNSTNEGHVTTEEVERHLQSRQFMELPERAPPTVPNEMFSNEPSLDSESNDPTVETSPSNVGEDCINNENMTRNEFNS
ncbi:uncharacterized protein LOC129613272 [Condylostylus longicornis]|uniref:uncharacterized protein LOC129613272 n=1 Tax=Condylostylus longicornis TaxID=2530218 RepID=UPI00244DB4EB|nr:uncharacterized protein LOC129613272 [Condylostylus longicornis]